MIKVYKYTIIVISFLMFFTAMLYVAFEVNTSQIYAHENEIEYRIEG